MQVTLLLVQALDLVELLRLVAAGEQGSLGGHHLGSHEAMQALDGELRGWWEAATPAQAPLLLAWAGFLALGNMLSPGGRCFYKQGRSALSLTLPVCH